MPVALGLNSCILIALVQCWVAAIAPASCTASSDHSDVISVGFPHPEGPHYYYDSSQLEFSWDAGVLFGALHLTQDEVYQPPVLYAPDAKRSAGHVRFQHGFTLALRSQSFYDGIWSEMQEASFNTTFTMSISGSRDYTAAGRAGREDDGLLLEVLPGHVSNSGFDRAIYSPFCSATSGNISVEIGKLQYYYDQDSFGLYVSIAPALTANTTAVNYTVWIEYDAKQHNLSVYVDDEGKAKPEQATVHAPHNISAVVTDVVEWYQNYYGDSRTTRVRGFGSRFGLFASKNRLLPSLQPVVYSWNLTMERLLPTSPTSGFDGRRRRVGWFLARVLPPVLAAAAATAIVVAVACCLASRYRALTMKLKLSKAMRRLPGIPREFGYAAVKKATRNFHESMRLGSGGFGAVYKGAMIATCDGDDGRQRLQYVEVAVKKFTRKENSSYDDFLAEVAVINRLRHRNIVPLIGWCYENGELLLIYQYMPNGSLDQHLFREKCHQQQLPILQWQTRYDVIKDIAAGLHYVHHEYERAVLHRDIKASNIMLDADFRGRLGDFGLARVVAFDKNSFTDMGVAGTWGFIAPEYAVSHKGTRRTDVYAFGVLVLEVVTGKRSLGAADSEFPLLIDWIWCLHGEGTLLEAVEDELTTMADFSPENATRMLLLGLACSDPNPSDRPSMDQVVQVIAKSMPPPAVPPVKPAFVWPPGGEQLLMLSDDADDDDDFVESDHRDSDRIQWEETEHYCDSLATGIKPSSEITQRKSRNVAETNISQDIEKCV
ncbi:probable L-type lectin-domain containing receptor kinase S.5 [Miscanthus floridulus]|uniref:probable L-type lectin-domain containing receptor kinase S.5 n=1 Tax=Miscanthus floridulus TaxID=154761 RepID=UPI0034586454